jgi:hypothetical protein
MAKVKISRLANYNDALDATNLGADSLIEELLKRKDYNKMSAFIKASHGL